MKEMINSQMKFAIGMLTGPGLPVFNSCSMHSVHDLKKINKIKLSSVNSTSTSVLFHLLNLYKRGQIVTLKINFLAKC